MDSQGYGGPLKILGKLMYPPKGRHWTYGQDNIYDLEKEERIRISERGVPQYLIDPTDKILIDTNWTDIPGYSNSTDYPTENSEQLLERIIKTASKEGDIVMDFFAGSGTTAIVAEKLGRKWITCDIGKLSFYTTEKRLLNIQNSKDLDNSKKQYDKQAKTFVTINTGHYDIEKVFKLQKEEYSDFVMELFEIKKTEKKIGGITIDGEKKDGFNCIIFPYWKFKDSQVDEEYLEDLHSHIGKKLERDCI